MQRSRQRIVYFLPNQKVHKEHCGPAQTSHFTCAEPNANKKESIVFRHLH